MSDGAPEFPDNLFPCHCFAKNVEFVPGYRNGHKPFGEWPARQLFTPRQWLHGGDSGKDLGAAKVSRRHGKKLQDVVGGRRVGFFQPVHKVYTAFGYPVGFPFDGQRQYRCISPFGGRDNAVSPPSIRIACDMTNGASGGGWIIKRHRKRFLVSVTSYGYVDDPDHLYGPYQGGVAKRLWRRAGD